MVGSLAAGTILDRLTRHGVPGTWVSVFTALVFIPCAVVTTTTGQVSVALTSLGLWFMCGAAFNSSQQTFVASAAPSQRATTVAWNNSMARTGIAVGTTALGFVVAGGTPFAAINGAFGLAALIAAALPLITKRRGRATAQTTLRS
jgi:predicted MFS family arabinose efflux permease